MGACVCKSMICWRVFGMWHPSQSQQGDRALDPVCHRCTTVDFERPTSDEAIAEARRDELPGARAQTVEYAVHGKFRMREGGTAFPGDTFWFSPRELKKSARTKNDGCMVTSRRALDAALVIDDLTTHEDHFLCDRDGTPRAPTSRNPFVCRCPMPCTPKQPHLLVAAHNPNMVKDRRQVMDTGDIDSASSVQRTTYERISHDRDRGCAPPAHQPSSVHFASIIASMLPLPCLACHAAPHFGAACYAGADAREIPTSVGYGVCDAPE